VVKGLRTYGKRLLVLLATMLVLELVLQGVGGNMQIAAFEYQPADGRCVGLKPGESVTYTGWLWPIDPVEHGANAYGYRGEPRPRDKPPGVFRIATLGDSFVYGQGVRAEDALAPQLEALLDGVQVLNFGAPGYNFEEYLDQYRHFVHHWSIDLLLLFIVDNDLEGAHCPRVAEDMAHRDDLMRRSYMVRAVVILGRFLRVLVGGGGTEETPEELLERTTRFTVELSRETQKHGTKLAAVVLSDPPVDPQTLADFFWLHRIPFMPSVAARLDLDRIAGEGHYSAEGLGELAAHLRDWLLAESLLPEAP
jgi:hypothetical protein